MNKTHIAHVALWTRDIEKLCDFYKRFFNASVSERYESHRRPGFISRFMYFSGETTIEVMQAPWLEAGENGKEITGYAHIAIAVGERSAVDALAKKAEAGDFLKSQPRQTGDGFYEAIIADPDGNLIEITV
ncbi:VOC family protein [Martelella mediterranea]|uniref:Lactoylglutathione lyase n=1 Tax=Martelella mediterranea TaxID=293089 RepID=A0A4V2V4X6_9HYPH|nr:VOC family protein [Martelella mediterranea]TCT44701.1 lactoylglutathione lyase [Martelella mediterranea]